MLCLFDANLGAGAEKLGQGDCLKFAPPPLLFLFPDKNKE